MAEEPSLPRLPAVSWDEHSQSFSNNPRKRVRKPRAGSVSSLHHNSSDPAIFSSDDDPGIDNYVEGRRKKRYVGSWFQQQPTSSDSTFSECHTLPRPRRTLARQFDSGVYLGSDETDGDDIADVLDMPVRSKLPLDPRPVAHVSASEEAARDKIRACLEQGDETVDFWSLGLEHISNETIKPLSNLTCIPVVAKDVAFEQKEPELKIYLAMNRLRLVPGALFDLTNLTILSLRGNKLTELPPAIAKLTNLTQLNVSQNRLSHLPAELLNLFQNRSGNKLRDLVLHPNPFFRPDGPFDQENRAPALKPDCANGAHFLTQALGRSPVQVFNSLGQVLSDFRFATSEVSRKLAVASQSERDAFARPSRVPSLMEAALRSCYSTSQLAELKYYIPDGLGHIQSLLERATKQKDIGGLFCSSCKQSIIVPTVEWVEWREISTCEYANGNTGEPVNVQPLSLVEDEKPVPFLHRACSWKCGPA